MDMEGKTLEETVKAVEAKKKGAKRAKVSLDSCSSFRLYKYIT